MSWLGSVCVYTKINELSWEGHYYWDLCIGKLNNVIFVECESIF